MSVFVLPGGSFEALAPLQQPQEVIGAGAGRRPPLSSALSAELGDWAMSGGP